MDVDPQCTAIWWVWTREDGVRRRHIASSTQNRLKETACGITVPYYGVQYSKVEGGAPPCTVCANAAQERDDVGVR